MLCCSWRFSFEGDDLMIAEEISISILKAQAWAFAYVLVSVISVSFSFSSNEKSTKFPRYGTAAPINTSGDNWFCFLLANINIQCLFVHVFHIIHCTATEVVKEVGKSPCFDRYFCSLPVFHDLRSFADSYYKEHDSLLDEHWLKKKTQKSRKNTTRLIPFTKTKTKVGLQNWRPLSGSY